MIYRIFCILLFSICINVHLNAEKPLDIDGKEATSIGIYIVDVKSGKVVYEYDSKRVLTPASITKSLTSASVINLLPTDFCYHTDIKITGEIIDGVLIGNLIISANGDPTLESKYFPKNAGLCDSIVSKIIALGITSIDGKYVFEYGNKSNDFGVNPRWQIEDVAWAYGTGYYPFNFRDNTFKLSVGDSLTTPLVYDLSLVDLTIPGENNNVDMMRGFDSYTLYLTGTSKDLSKYEVNCAMPYPEDVFTMELTDSLASAGVSILNNEITFASDTLTIYSHYSPTIKEILKSLMIRSDNLFAEGVLRALAPDSMRHQALAMQEDYWNAQGLNCDYITVHDGSGLARGNKLSPEFMGQMLLKMTKTEKFKDYLSLFPRVGKEGTVKNFLRKTRLKGMLALKTGSMNGVQCYAGYKLDNTGNATHAVVIMINNFYCKRSELRSAIEKFLLTKF